MAVTVYADVLVIVNLYVDFFLLWATRRVLQLRAKPWRLAAGALVGGLCAFLIYNFHPAKVFMGDTGSLFLGGAVCGLAFALDVPLVLIPVGIIYIAETLSDIIQVGYFKLTHGKRIFRMAPLHHHLEMGGWSEVKLFCVFSGITLLACLLTWLVGRLRVGGLAIPAAVPPILSNAVIVGALELTFFLPGVTGTAALAAWNALTVGIGEVISCGILGVALVKLIESNTGLRRLFCE